VVTMAMWLSWQVCFIKTTNLDGETNLKIRKPMDLKGVQVGLLAVFNIFPIHLSYISVIRICRTHLSQQSLYSSCSRFEHRGSFSTVISAILWLGSSEMISL
jgi:hypothetical protein